MSTPLLSVILLASTVTFSHCILVDSVLLCGNALKELYNNRSLPHDPSFNSPLRNISGFLLFKTLRAISLGLEFTSLIKPPSFIKALVFALRVLSLNVMFCFPFSLKCGKLFIISLFLTLSCLWNRARLIILLNSCFFVGLLSFFSFLSIVFTLMPACRLL